MPQNHVYDYEVIIFRASMFTITEVQSQAILARMALIVGAETFDKMFVGVEFAEVEGDILYVFAPTEEQAGDIENNFSLHLIIIATDILKHDIGIVTVMPRVLH